MPQDWKLARGAPACCRCGSEFPDGQAFFSALSEQQGDFARQDFCLACWQEAKHSAFFCFWKTRRSTQDRRPRVELDAVFQFFDNLRGADRPDRKEMRFVLALYLARRRALRLVGVSREDGRELLEFRRPRADESFLVENPHLTEEQINATTERIKDLFRTEL